MKTTCTNNVSIDGNTTGFDPHGNTTGFDPDRRLPINVLHAIKLGLVELWIQTKLKSMTPMQKQELAARLKMFDSRWFHKAS